MPSDQTAAEASVKAEFPSARVDKRGSFYFITARVPDLPGRRDFLLGYDRLNERSAWENAARNIAGADESSEIVLALELQRAMQVNEKEMIHDKSVEAGDAYCLRMGWETRDDGMRIFTATLWFKNGPPVLPMNAAWGDLPLRLVLKEPTDA